MWTSPCHNCKDSCICTRDRASLQQHPQCPVTGHRGSVSQVQFSDDGAQVISGGRTVVRFWDIASGTQVRQIACGNFVCVEGPRRGHLPYLYFLTIKRNLLLILECQKEQHDSDADRAKLPVACFKTPQTISSVWCHGAAICVGCSSGAVLMFSAPFLAA